MINKTNLHKLTPFGRQVLMHEMFCFCDYIDHSVINQYFPFVDYCPIGLKLPTTAMRMVTRDLKDLRDAGVIDYEYKENEKWFESYACDYKLKIPENTDEKRKKYLKHLNFICRYIYKIIELEDEIQDQEIKEDAEMDEDIFDYKLELRSYKNAEKTLPNDYELYRYDDPYVAEYIKLNGKTTLEQIKADFEFLQEIGYLEYNFWRRRFCMPQIEDYDFFELPRQSFGIVRGEDGKFYI